MPEGFVAHLDERIVECEEIREPFIEIRLADSSGTGKLITTIELLSPANKTGGSDTGIAYRKKQQDLLYTDTHLLEIDLLRAGKHTVAIPEADVVHEFGSWDYLYCLHRAGDLRRFEVLAWSVRQRIPHIPIPLTDDLPDISFDIQSAVNETYTDGLYARSIDYAEELEMPSADRQWLDTLLREKGLRG